MFYSPPVFMPMCQGDFVFLNCLGSQVICATLRLGSGFALVYGGLWVDWTILFHLFGIWSCWIIAGHPVQNGECGVLWSSLCRFFGFHSWIFRLDVRSSDSDCLTWYLCPARPVAVISIASFLVLSRGSFSGGQGHQVELAGLLNWPLDASGLLLPFLVSFFSF
jgi:hypothetical protein